jgi:hypothetical protein
MALCYYSYYSTLLYSYKSTTPPTPPPPPPPPTPIPILLLLYSTILYSTPIPTTTPILYCPPPTALYICSNNCVLYIVQRTKQPYGSVLCGFYVCKYLRTCTRFSSSWRQLKKAQGWWRREKVDQNFRQIVVDICKFVTECAHEGWLLLNKESELALNPKFERIKNWSTKLQIKDYILPDLFFGKSW